MAVYSYSSTAVATALSAAITSTSATTMTCPESASDNGWPSTFPFVLAIDYGSVGVELVTVTSKGGLAAGIRTWNITRGFDFTTASTHPINAPVRHVIAARDLRQSQRLQPDDAENTYIMRETVAGTEFTDSLVGDMVIKAKSGSNILLGLDAAGFSSMAIGASGVQTSVPLLIAASAGAFRRGAGQAFGTNYVQMTRASVQQTLTASTFNDVAFNNGATALTPDDGSMYSSPYFICQKSGMYVGMATLSYTALGQKYIRWFTQGGSVVAQSDSAAGGTLSCPLFFYGPSAGYQIKVQTNPNSGNLQINSSTTPTAAYFGQVL